MQDIRQETLNECTRAEQSASVVLWEIDLTEVGGERYFFCNEQNEKGEPVTWQGRQYQPYPIQGSGFELNGKGTSTRPTLTVSNLYGMVTGMAEDMQSLVGGTVVRRKVYARFLDAVNFVNGNSYADPEQEVISRWRIEQCSELSAVSASFVLSTPTETDGAIFPGRIMLANTCTWTYRGDECGYSGPADGKQNTYFSSLDNMVAQGNVLPVLYGEMRVGSRVVSQEISTADEGDGGQVVVIGR
ncbi:phage minor tail protein L [Escherichia coli O13,129,135:H11]